ncbi:MAG: hypothetical protein H7288_05360, partial [Kineosporiaceae bacterium]|nr:hypothetical protein [Aeromicrobium sp.]
MGLRNKKAADGPVDVDDAAEPRRGFSRRHRLALIAFLALVSILIVSVAGFALILNSSLSNIRKVP